MHVSLYIYISISTSLSLSASDSLKKPLKSLHRRAIKIVLLKRTSLTNKDYKAAQILSLSSRLMSNKARFVHKIVSGRAPMYLSTKLLISQSSRNSSRKLNVPMPRIDLFKSSLVYSGPVLWNSLPSELRLPVSPSVIKKHLTLHMLSLLGVTWNHDHRYFIYIYIHAHRAQTHKMYGLPEAAQHRLEQHMDIYIWETTYEETTYEA